MTILLDHRNQFIREFFVFLSDRKYALLKYFHNDIADLDEFSDLDIAINRTDMVEVSEFLNGYDDISCFKIFKKSHMSMVYVHFNDRSFLELDFIFDFSRKHLTYMEHSELLDNVFESDQGIKLPRFEFNFLYIFLFYFLNGECIPKKYAISFQNLCDHEKEFVIDFLKQKLSLSKVNQYDLFNYDQGFKKDLSRAIAKKMTFGKSLKNYNNYLFDILSGRKKAIIITFSGVDGAGKTTILSSLKDLLETKYRREVVVLRHRPSILPILSALKYGKKAAEQRSMATLPRLGKNTSYVSSFCRFLYYYLDYLVGQWAIFIRHNLRGKVVIYDRYYFDFICDARRTNIKIKSKLVKALYKFLLKPHINVFLWADVPTILHRKRELEGDAIYELTVKYKSLFEELNLSNPEKYIVIENTDAGETIKKIEDLYIGYENVIC